MQYSTWQKGIESKLFWPKSTILKSKSAKYYDLKKIVSEIYKIKIGWSPELMNDIFGKTETEKYGIESFSKWM